MSEQINTTTAKRADFDIFNAQRLRSVNCTILGITYTDVPELPFGLGLDLQYMDRESAARQLEIVEQVIDYVFGPGTFAAWRQDTRLQSETFRRVMQWISSGYSDDYLAALESLQKNAEEPATAGEISTSGNTGG
jgi:hypothetical protein